MIRAFVLWLAIFIFFVAAAVPLSARDFQYAKDTLAFANETVFHHDGMKLAVIGEAKPPSDAYNRRCFVVCRAILQFHKFARFDPRLPAPDDATLAKLIRKITKRPVWRPDLPEAERVVIPGYADMRELSAKRVNVIQRNLGLGWPTYVRPGNFCYVFPPSTERQRNTVAAMDAELKERKPTILWLTEFPSFQMNHTVLVIARKLRADGCVIYTVCDPNYADQSRELYYWPANGNFFYAQTFYANAGFVKVRAVYRSPWQ